MAEEDELYYLQPDFDLNTLTIPRIRAILVSHEVSYPSSAKKGQLVEIFEQEILPKAKKLLKAQARVRRTSKGITDVPSSRDSTIDDDEDDNDRGQMLPPPVPKTPRSRKSKTNVGEDESAVTPATTRKSKTPSTRKSAAKAPRASDTETDGDKAKRSPRKSTKAISQSQVVKLEEPGVKLKHESFEADESPFSDDNPFQSGSSPPSGSNRKSLGAERRKSANIRRRTASPNIIKQEDDYSRSRTTYNIPIGRMSSHEQDDGIPVTEEFTPDAARELEQEAANGQLVPSRTSKVIRRRKKPVSTAAKVTPLAILTTVLAGVAGWYRQEKVNIGYCGVGEPNWSLSSNPNIPIWVHENLQPTCEPCPQHAICYPNMEVKCETDFILQQHPLTLNGLVPLPPTCEPDSEKERRIKAVADRAVEELRERRAAYECGEDIKSGSVESSETSKSVINAGTTKLEIPEEVLKKEVGKMRRKGMTEEEFEDLWRGALGDVINRDEIDVIRDGSGSILVSSSSLAKISFTCAIRRSIIRAISENRIPLSILVMIFSGLVYGRNKVISYQQASAQIPQLVSTTLDRLATHAALKEDGRVAEGFISVGQLRDDVLRNVFNASERERVWQGVRKVVEANSNVRSASREGGKTGEWSRVWEWIGPVDLAPGIEGRRSGGLIQESPSSPGDDTHKTSNREEIMSRKWDEGRPVY